jgi:Fe2+ or Zn2+ uptake regulation protein
MNHRIEPAFLPAAAAPGDRLVCTRCGGITPLDASDLLAGIHGRAAARGLSVESHALTLYGRCWVCRASEVRA